MDLGTVRAVSVSKYLNTQGVTRAAATGHDGDGQPTWGGAASLRCRYEFVKRRLTLATGETVVSSGRVFVEAGQAAALNDKITYSGTTFRVVEIAEQMGFNSLNHKMLWLAG